MLGKGWLPPSAVRRTVRCDTMLYAVSAICLLQVPCSNLSFSLSVTHSHHALLFLNFSPAPTNTVSYPSYPPLIPKQKVQQMLWQNIAVLPHLHHKILKYIRTECLRCVYTEKIVHSLYAAFWLQLWSGG